MVSESAHLYLVLLCYLFILTSCNKILVYFLQGGPSKLVQKHLSGLFNSIASFYHPSNNGRWLVSFLHVDSNFGCHFNGQTCQIKR